MDELNKQGSSLPRAVVLLTDGLPNTRPEGGEVEAEVAGTSNTVVAGTSSVHRSCGSGGKEGAATASSLPLDGGVAIEKCRP